jgi:hypothetical protein
MIDVEACFARTLGSTILGCRKTTPSPCNAANTADIDGGAASTTFLLRIGWHQQYKPVGNLYFGITRYIFLYIFYILPVHFIFPDVSNIHRRPLPLVLITARGIY